MRLQTVFAVLLVLVSSWPPAAFAYQNPGPATIQNQTGAALLAEIANVRQKAERRDAQAQYTLGHDYLVGAGVPQDRKQGAQWYAAAAAQGLAQAQFALGYLYEHGEGVGKDYHQAGTDYRAAAEQGHAAAENNLASLYQHGWGVPKDLDQAIYWYRRSAQHGDPTGQCNLASLYFTGEGIPKDDGAAARWFRAAAEQGLPAAQTNLAFMYYHGRGVPLAYTQSAIWTRRAAEQGYAQAQTDLGYLYEQGKGVPLDYVTAYRWYRSAAAGGDRRAGTRMKSLARTMTRDQLAAAAAPRAVATQPEAKGCSCHETSPRNRGAVPQPSPGRGPTRTAIENSGAERGSIFSVALSGPRVISIRRAFFARAGTVAWALQSHHVIAKSNHPLMVSGFPFQAT